MSLLLATLASLVAFVLAGAVLVRTDARQLARALRQSGPILLLAVGLGLSLLGRVALGSMLITGALAMFAATRKARAKVKTPRRHSTVRTAALEMELDHDSGALEGLVLAGRHDGRELGSLNLHQLLELVAEIRHDNESRQLLETYLDGRFPAWRESADANHGAGQGVPPGSGAMTKQEAYQVLGLETGAAAAEVRKAHRRLMQRLHPDLGGSSFLAARINEAKDVLLSNHE